MSNEALQWTMQLLMGIMQASIIVPMVVVWRRWGHFPSAIKLLSWYVYLSAAASFGARFLYPRYFDTNYGFAVAFNLGKIALFCAVYYQVLAPTLVRRILVGATLLTLAGILGFITMGGYNAPLGVDISRVAQCALLAAFALVYLEQTLNRAATFPAARDPLWLLSVAQLIYSAGTVTTFSLDHLSKTKYDQSLKFIFVAIVGLAFNWLLTKAFLRADSAEQFASKAKPEPASSLVHF